MCSEKMDTRSKHLKNNCPRTIVKPGPRLRWRAVRISPEDDEALRRCGSTAVRVTIRKNIHREKRREQLAKLSKILADVESREQRESSMKERPAAACFQRQPAGAMAPQNTTQYLMRNVYADMETNNVPHETQTNVNVEPLSPVAHRPVSPRTGARSLALRSATKRNESNASPH